VIEWYREGDDTPSVDPDLAASIGTRFFVFNDDRAPPAGTKKRDHRFNAHELHVEYGLFFKEAMAGTDSVVIDGNPLKG